MYKVPHVLKSSPDRSGMVNIQGQGKHLRNLNKEPNQLSQTVPKIQRKQTPHLGLIRLLFQTIYNAIQEAVGLFLTFKSPLAPFWDSSSFAAMGVGNG